jgi:hypothetical protein
MVEKIFGWGTGICPLSPLKLRPVDAIYPVPEVSFKTYCQGPKQFPTSVPVHMGEDEIFKVLRA